MEAGDKYPLEQVALIKQKKLEETEKNLKAKKELLLQEEEKLRTTEKERDSVKEHRIAKLTQLRENLDLGTSTDKIQQMKAYFKIVEEKLKVKEQKVQEQLKKVNAAKEQVELARQLFLKKTQEVEKFRLHKQEWDKEIKVLIEREEAGEGDELGSAMHVRRKKPKRP